MRSETSPELEVYASELTWLCGQLLSCLTDLDEEAVSYRGSPDGNSALAILNHVVGTTRAYVLGMGCGLDVGRDREAEFGAAPPRADLIETADALRMELPRALQALDPSRLDRRFVPSAHLYGAGEPREMSPREAIVEGLRHAALHLGELRLVRDLALAANRRG